MTYTLDDIIVNQIDDENDCCAWELILETDNGALSGKTMVTKQLIDRSVHKEAFINQELGFMMAELLRKANAR
jgi:hypothetical protein